MAPKDIMEIYDADGDELRYEVTQDFSKLLHYLYVYLKDDPYKIVRSFKTTIDGLGMDTYDSIPIYQKVTTELDRVLQADGVKYEELDNTKDALFKLAGGTLPELYDTDIRDVVVLMYYPKYKAEQLMQLESNKQFIRELLSGITADASPIEETDGAGDIMVLLAEDGIFGKEAVDTVDKIYELIPEATRNSYPNKYKAVLDFYPVYKEMGGK